jgi:hypothetical protein
MPPHERPRSPNFYRWILTPFVRTELELILLNNQIQAQLTQEENARRLREQARQQAQRQREQQETQNMAFEDDLSARVRREQNLRRSARIAGQKRRRMGP